MRNWNPQFENVDIFNLEASRLPMRNWNSRVPTTYGSGKASRLPMRNWNSVLRDRFRSTLGTLPDYLWGIETSCACPCDRSMLGFQTTYEELKPTASVSAISWSCTASRLPMRNWNLLPHRLSGSRKRLPDYLWGIETTIVLRMIKQKYKLPDYLWGIETSPTSSRASSASALPDYLWGIETDIQNLDVIRADDGASRLPMRNWNKVPEEAG